MYWAVQVPSRAVSGFRIAHWPAQEASGGCSKIREARYFLATYRKENATAMAQNVMATAAACRKSRDQNEYWQSCEQKHGIKHVQHHSVVVHNQWF
mmetsp:Transcript_49431/g.72250  ORF Transcript_49431/g.72250 Transcript_49431/m.72250 type:complete len:96 (+) Transcript_49431:1252-1539(+)